MPLRGHLASPPVIMHQEDQERCEATDVWKSVRGAPSRGKIVSAYSKVKERRQMYDRLSGGKWEIVISDLKSSNLTIKNHHWSSAGVWILKHYLDVKLHYWPKNAWSERVNQKKEQHIWRDVENPGLPVRNQENISELDDNVFQIESYSTYTLLRISDSGGESVRPHGWSLKSCQRLLSCTEL